MIYLFSGENLKAKLEKAEGIASEFNLNVYRIDLSMVVSKFIGETEKNLAELFIKADNKKLLLFFDEADALFGKRTEVKDSRDRYANLETSYLLRYLERFSGIVILSTNSDPNVDESEIKYFKQQLVFSKTLYSVKNLSISP